MEDPDESPLPLLGLSSPMEGAKRLENKKVRGMRTSCQKRRRQQRLRLQTERLCGSPARLALIPGSGECTA